jgi:2'-phosphotransferase
MTWEELSKLPSPCGGVIVIRLGADNNAECVIVQEKGDDPVKINTGFPKGKCEKSKKKENILECAKRELEEESGIKFTQLKFVNDFYVEECTTKGNLAVIYFVALYVDPNEHIFSYNSGELQMSKFLSVNDAEKVLSKNRKQLLNIAHQKLLTSPSYTNGADLVNILENLKDNKKENEKVNELVSISKTMTWILRHKAIDLGLKVDSSGWVSVDSILLLDEMKGVDENLVKKIVGDDSKKRFEIKTENGTLMIRAVQGHSKGFENILNDSESLSEIKMPLKVCVHGTTKKAWELIKQEGLKCMERLHMHFATGEPGDNEVISGMRKDCKVMIYVNMKSAMDDGIKFYLSKNNVILTNGIDGKLSVKYFENVIFK